MFLFALVHMTTEKEWCCRCLFRATGNLFVQPIIRDSSSSHRRLGNQQEITNIHLPTRSGRWPVHCSQLYNVADPA
jgi:hypothetical protein